MPKLVGALRIKDEEIFLPKTLQEACGYCDEFAIINDWSSDKSIEIISEICYSNRIPFRLIKSCDKRYHEGRDRDQLLQLAVEMKANWCIQIDADEVYECEFVKNIQDFLKFKVDVIWVGITQMWSLENRKWNEVDTFRVDDGWTTSFYEDGTGIQHERPALFRVYNTFTKSGSLRDHGYLCPKELWGLEHSFYCRKVLAHFGYATPTLIEKKCIRHGSIPAVTQEEIEGTNYEPDWKPEFFDKDAAIKTFRKEWLKKSIELRKLTRKIWS